MCTGCNLSKLQDNTCLPNLFTQLVKRRQTDLPACPNHLHSGNSNSWQSTSLNVTTNARLCTRSSGINIHLQSPKSVSLILILMLSYHLGLLSSCFFCQSCILPMNFLSASSLVNLHLLVTSFDFTNLIILCDVYTSKSRRPSLYSRILS